MFRPLFRVNTGHPRGPLDPDRQPCQHPAVTDDPSSLFARISALPVKVRNRLLFDLLADAGATGIVIPGENGEIEGYLADRTITLKYLKNKSWSIEKIALAERYFARHGGGSYVDLGANIGTTVVPIARLEGVTCHAVEPDAANFRLLTLNLIRNGVADRVVTHNVAIDIAEGEAVFELAPENLGDHRLRRGEAAGNAYHERERRTTTVPTRPLDAIVPAAALRDPLVVKMDIQGAEPFAFASGEAVFARAALLLTEYWPYGIRRLGGGLDALHEAFARHFRFGAVLDDDQRPETVELEPIAAVIGRLGAVGREKEAEAIDLVLSRDPSLFDPA